MFAERRQVRRQMKIFSYRGNPNNNTYRILLPAAAFLLVLMVNSTAVRAGDEKPKRDLIDRQVFSDMMYGADDYFGENTDLAYADGATPTVIVPVAPTTPTATPTATPTVAPAPPPPPPVVTPVSSGPA
jgi:hypothetical protein